MTNEVVQWKDEMARHAKDVAAAERPSVSSVSLKSGVMSINKVPIPGNRFECVVVLGIFENQYFPDKYDPDRIVPPECFAFSETGEDMVPHEAARTKVATDCESCPNSKWGSAEQGRGKACKEKRKLALLPAIEVTEGRGKSCEMAILTLPVTSVKHWSNFVNHIAAEYQRPPWGVICEISAVPDPKSQFQVKFTTKGLVHDERLGEVYSRIPQAKELMMTPYTYEAEEPEDEAPKKKKKY